MRATNNPAISLVAGTALLANRLATLNASTGVADYCSATLVPIGQTMDTVDATEMQGVRLLSAGTLELTASGAVTKGAPVYTDASGKVSATAADGARCVGIALDAASADGDIIGVLPSAIAAALVVQDLSALTVGAALTDSTGGAANTTLVTVGATNGSDVSGVIKDNFADLALRVNELRADLVAIRADLVASGLFLT